MKMKQNYLTKTKEAAKKSLTGIYTKLQKQKAFLFEADFNDHFWQVRLPTNSCYDRDIGRYFDFAVYPKASFYHKEDHQKIAIAYGEPQTGGSFWHFMYGDIICFPVEGETTEKIRESYLTQISMLSERMMQEEDYFSLSLIHDQAVKEGYTLHIRKPDLEKKIKQELQAYGLKFISAPTRLFSPQRTEAYVRAISDYLELKENIKE